MNLGKYLIRHRRLTGKTQTELGKEIGISAMAISAIERGKINPKITTLQKILPIIGITITEVFNEPNP